MNTFISIATSAVPKVFKKTGDFLDTTLEKIVKTAGETSAHFTKHTELRIKNETGEDIVTTNVEGLDNFDWDTNSDFRPDVQLEGLAIASGTTVQKRLEVSRVASNCPIQLTFFFQSGAVETVKFNQKFARGKAVGGVKKIRVSKYHYNLNKDGHHTAVLKIF